MNKTNCTSIWRLAGPGALVCYALLAPLSALCSSLFALSLQPVVDTGLFGDLGRFGLACLAAFLLGAVDLALNHWTVCRQAALVHRCTNRLCQHYLHLTLAQKVERLQGQDSAVYLSKLTADAPPHLLRLPGQRPGPVPQRLEPGRLFGGAGSGRLGVGSPGGALRPGLPGSAQTPPAKR